MERDIKCRLLNERRGKFLDIEIDPYSLGSIEQPTKGEEITFEIKGKDTYTDILVPLERRIDLTKN